MATLNSHRGSGHTRSRRTRLIPNGRSLRLETLENRLALSGYVFIDYGDNFPLVGSTRTLNTTIEGLINIADSATPNDKVLGTAIGDSAGFSAFSESSLTSYLLSGVLNFLAEGKTDFRCFFRFDFDLAQHRVAEFLGIDIHDIFARV